MTTILPWQRESLQSLMARRDALPHALLVHGRRGIGKVEFARALAQSLLCEAHEDSLACGRCGACGWFSASNHPDYRELMPEAMAESSADEILPEPVDPDAREKKKSIEIRVDQVRALGEFMMLSAHRDGFRVLLLHPAEALNPAAANALLKTLEEPPARTVIILVAEQLGRLLATVRSRCQKVLLLPPPQPVGVAWLLAQGIGDAEAALAAAGGAPLDAVIFADREYRGQRDAFVAALSAPPVDFVAAGQTFEKTDLNLVIHWLQTWVSDLLRHKTTGEVRYFPREVRAVGAIAAKANTARLFRFDAELRRSRRLASHPLNARLFLEQLLICYALSIRP